MIELWLHIYGRHLYVDIYKTIIKRRNVPYCWIGRCNIILISVLLRLLYRFNAILVRIPKGGFLFLF